MIKELKMNTVVETKEEVANNDVLKDVKKAGGFNADRTLTRSESQSVLVGRVALIKQAIKSFMGFWPLALDLLGT
jgi:hypothetical protein